ncbi:2-octaprenyl-6-methoxyphenyl hydroxylase [Microbulbifer yueqingensis]|uniref:2-octaprenyl-6-methoxyphenol hydroxylase /2-octaprenyl-3-methyl-6-methoxy-1,4-benzoquinol hydroxylase n=1 Tax=Microbulbifer yueqingensis TaxID=658219 RepID=A0A1G8YF41_9GAMM|nr:2-octaprenyl-6-methoxyphenyl hydroxylase [Microbulbifer yueqingensis]SDK01366.1 2-octaprenyl-6-methoxyphenol hydroxylase /2-octaprenyl-3-methyl-6-methoxy-1,4-benzoquinol hydroxylase [Microbulbifer yueqingensis]
MSQPEEFVDVAIVGGGMAGASLALMLQQFCPHLSVALLEQHPLPDAGASIRLPSFDARATALAAGSLQLFDRLGLWSRLKEYAAPIRRVQVSDRGHALGVSLRARREARASFDDMLGAVIENAALGPVLHGALAATAVQLLAPARVTELQMTPEGVRLQWHRGEEGAVQSLRAGLLVVADGVNSPLCRRLGIDTEQVTYNQRALVTTVGVQRDHGGVAYERFTADGPMALLPLPRRHGRHRMALVWTSPGERAGELEGLSDGEFVARLQRTFGWRAGRIECCGEVSSYPLSLSLAREQWRRDLVLVGNCAHFLHPVAGQGFNLTLRDCYGLAQALACGEMAQNSSGRLDLLQEYARERRLDQQLTIGFSDRVPSLFAAPGLLAGGLRQAGLLGLALAPPLRAGFAGQAAGFGL